MEPSILEQLKKPQLIKEIKAVKGYEKYLNIDLYQNELINNISHCLYCIDFRIEDFVYLNKNTELVFGYSHAELSENGPMGLYSLLHPKDVEILNKKVYTSFAEFIHTKKDIDLSKYKFSYNCRIKQKNGSYKVLLSKFSCLVIGEKGLPLMIMGTMSDITDIYKENELYCDIYYHEKNSKPKKVLHKVFSLSEKESQFNISKKELEVLSMIAKGMISKEIASYTNRSIETIHSHRKNILKKLNCNNITDAIIIAKENKWV